MYNRTLPDLYIFYLEAQSGWVSQGVRGDFVLRAPTAFTVSPKEVFYLCSASSTHLAAVAYNFVREDELPESMHFTDFE